jgi:hypothetical protein
LSAPSREALSSAFHTQARSDWAVYLHLAALPEHPRCHALHYLQMATEKLGKAYRLRDTSAATEDLQSEHTGFASFLRLYINQRASSLAADRETNEALRPRAVALAREVERLHPSVDKARCPQNTEYPWPEADQVGVPVHYDFPNLSFLRDPKGRAFLALVQRAFDDFC